MAEPHEAPVLYRWLVLQDGSLPLQPDGHADRAIEHVCTTTLVWPADARLFAGKGLVVDPCFSESGLQGAKTRLLGVGGSLNRLHHYYESHAHFDHRLQFDVWQPSQESESQGSTGPNWAYVPHGAVQRLFPGIEEVATPGHATDLMCLRFPAAEGDVWIVGDAILNRQWLTAWAYYWPNGYSPNQIVATWRSVARILAAADLVIPGHGEPIRVDAGLLQQVLGRFPEAEYAKRCPEVADQLRTRYHRLLLRK